VKHPFQLILLYALLCLSGFAGLGYEIVWARMLAVGLGHEILAVLAVIAAFFAGLALGAWALDGAVSRSRVPGRWYAGFELTIGLWSLALIAIIPWANRAVALLIGTDPSPAWHWAVAFVVPFFLLLPATAAMGGTLPAMERLFSRLAQDGRSVAGLYAANTFGAFAGTLLATFLIVPALGIGATLLLLAAVNFICAAGVGLGAARGEAGRPAVDAPAPGDPVSARRLFGTLFLTGLLGIGYAVLVVRVLAQVMENTVYSFASVLAVYLLGTAAGAALYQRFLPRTGFRAVLSTLLLAVSLACIAGIFVLGFAPVAYDVILSRAGPGFAGAVTAEVGVAALVLALPTAAMGALFSHLAQGAREAGGGLGRALGINTLGASLAPLLFGVLSLPAVGSLAALAIVSAGYVLLLPRARLRTLVPAGVSLAAVAALLLGPVDLRFVTPPPGGRVVEHVEGVMADVSVVADRQDQLHLKVNNHFRMGSTGSAFSDRRQGYIPLLLHPDPKRALFLGLGTGATFAAAADFPGLEADGVELVPEIVPMIRHFAPVTGDLDKAPQLHLTVADARRYVQATDKTYDVIVADLFHPARDGAGSLYTREHFAAVKARLAEGGVFCQWLPLHQLDLPTLRVIIRTFLAVFPDGSAYLAHYSLQTPLLALVGGKAPLRFSPDWLDRRLHDRAFAPKLAALRLASPYALFGAFVAGGKDLAAFAGNGPFNTDDRPIVIFQAPSSVYGRLGPPSERLFALLDSVAPRPSDVLLPDAARAGKRLAAYWAARDQFLKAGEGVAPTDDVQAMVAQVRRPLLAAVRTSPDFDAAYMPLLSLAAALHRVDPSGARALLAELADANPARREARVLLDRFAD
jgi:spermidine synthase